jgi:hypothetical protein
MKHLVLFLIIVFLALNEGYGQEIFKRKTVYAELLGAGGLASVNFDYRLGKNPEGFGLRTGIGYFQWNNSSLVTFPVIVNYLVGKNGKYLDLGLGARFGYETMVDKEPPSPDQKFEEGFRIGAPILNIGYRYQPLEGGFNFRIGFSPYMNIYKNALPDLFWMPHLSLGYTL